MMGGWDTIHGSRWARVGWAGWLLGLCLLACSRKDPGTLTVFAAASCAGWMQELPDDAPMHLQFGPSSGLARQIADGAPAQVFITAHERWMNFLGQQGKLDGDPIAFAQNTLVCVALRSTAFEGGLPDSLAMLRASLRMDDRIAIADASVPAGEYVRQALTAAGQIETLSELFVGQDDAGSTLRAVTLGQAKVGFVYASDARSAEFRILFRLDPKTHDPIRYWACAIQGEDPSPAASQFLTGLRTQAVQDVLRRHGFAPVN